jgi:peptidyl-prolyl cis-trans isomerase B (cyclophilin B)
VKTSHWILSALLLAVAPAAAQDAPLPAPRPLELSASVDKETVEVGGTIKLTVKLKNSGTSPIEVMGVEDGKLLEDRQVVSFDAKIDDGRVFHVTRIHPQVESPRRDWPKATLAPGQSAELTLDLPALTAGAWQLTAGYRRGSDDALAATPVTVTVAPTAKGETDVEVTMITTLGPIRMRLFPRDALGTCLNFARLITQGAVVDDKPRPRFYDGLIFHRVIPGFMVQGGCPQGTGMGNPGYNIPAEFAQAPIKENLLHVPGRLSMARATHNDSAGCQFFICVATPSNLDGQYAVFGEVVRGLDVAYAMASVETSQDRPLEPIRIVSMRLGVAPKRVAPDKPQGE